MRTRSSVLLFTATALVLVPGCKEKSPVTANVQSPAPAATSPSAPNSPEAVQQTFTAFLAATKERRGTDAAELVDAGTLARHEEDRKLALTASRATLKSMDFRTRWSVVRLRTRVPRADLERLDGKGLFAYGADKGWEHIGGPDSVTDVVISGNTATATIVIKGTKTSPVSFVAEDGRWRFKKSEIDDRSTTGSQKGWTKSGRTEDEAILQAASQIANRTIGDEIWDPPK